MLSPEITKQQDVNGTATYEKEIGALEGEGGKKKKEGKKSSAGFKPHKVVGESEETNAVQAIDLREMPSLASQPDDVINEPN